MIAELLGEGAENATTGRELATLLNCDLRSITEQIERERREGRPICASCTSDNPGYYLAADPDELRRYCDRLHKRAAQMYKTRRALLDVLRKLTERAEHEEHS